VPTSTATSPTPPTPAGSSPMTLPGLPTSAASGRSRPWRGSYRSTGSRGRPSIGTGARSPRPRQEAPSKKSHPDRGRRGPHQSLHQRRALPGGEVGEDRRQRHRPLPLGRDEDDRVRGEDETGLRPL